MKYIIIYKIILPLFLYLIFFFSLSYAADDAFDVAGLNYNINPDILRAIAYVESHYYPYSINIKGKSYYPQSLNSASSLLKTNLNKTYDVGLMQVNKFWFDRFNLDPCYGLNRIISINLAVYILSKEIKRYGYTWKAIGAYHSPDPRKQIRYIRKVQKFISSLANGKVKQH